MCESSERTKKLINSSASTQYVLSRAHCNISMLIIYFRYGYRTTPEILQFVQENEDLGKNLCTAAHLIHGSSEGRLVASACHCDLPWLIIRVDLQSQFTLPTWCGQVQGVLGRWQDDEGGNRRCWVRMVRLCTDDAGTDSRTCMWLVAIMSILLNPF